MSMINKCDLPILRSLMVFLSVGSTTVFAPTTLIVVKSEAKKSLESAPYILYSTGFADN